MAEEAMLDSEISGLHVVAEGYSRQQDKPEEKNHGDPRWIAQGIVLFICRPFCGPSRPQTFPV